VVALDFSCPDASRRQLAEDESIAAGKNLAAAPVVRLSRIDDQD
jgi:hypothetical protein